MELEHKMFLQDIIDELEKRAYQARDLKIKYVIDRNYEEAAEWRTIERELENTFCNLKLHFKI